jgi:hypothetical protein
VRCWASVRNVKGVGKAHHWRDSNLPNYVPAGLWLSECNLTWEPDWLVLLNDVEHDEAKCMRCLVKVERATREHQAAAFDWFERTLAGIHGYCLDDEVDRHNAAVHLASRLPAAAKAALYEVQS